MSVANGPVRPTSGAPGRSSGSECCRQPHSPIPLVVERLARGDTRGTDRYGHRSDLGQTPIIANAVPDDLVKASQQDIHEILILADGVVQRGTARADDCCAEHAQRAIWS